MLGLFFFPLFSFLVLFFGARFFSKIGAAVFLFFYMIAMFAMVGSLFYEVGLCGASFFIDGGFWFSIHLLEVKFFFWFDVVTATMLLLVTIVAVLVHLYS